jgi:hypothetical protein
VWRSFGLLSLRVEVNPVNVRDAGEIERGIATFARSANGGLIVTGSALTAVHRDLITTLAARHRLPAVYPYLFYANSGGLISYGPDLIDQYRKAARYVDRILKGEKPADLPVQAPTKYETVINLKTAKALGLTVPETLIGFLGAQSADLEYKLFAVPFLRGLRETGYVEGQNVVVEYRYAENQLDRVPALAADLVRRRPAGDQPERTHCLAEGQSQQGGVRSSGELAH